MSFLKLGKLYLNLDNVQTISYTTDWNLVSVTYVDGTIGEFKGEDAIKINNYLERKSI